MKLVRCRRFLPVAPTRITKAQRVLLNILTGWTCPGFCEGDGEWLEKCDKVCGIGRVERPSLKLLG